MAGAPTGNLNGKKWTTEHTDALRSFVTANQMSYANIAAKLNEQFGTTYSRNAAIGRAGRMGLINPFKVKTYKPSGGKKKNRARPRIENKARPRIISSNGNSNSFRIIQSVENVADPKLRCVEIVPRNITLIDLDPGDCRYPYGDGPITFCGHPKLEGSSYCGPHRALAVTHHLGVGHASSEAQKAASRKSIASIIILQNDAVNALDLA